MSNADTLKDVLQPNLKLVICGTAVGNHSAKVGLYYANNTNLFWKILFETGLTADKHLNPSEYENLRNYGIGLTDIAKKAAGIDTKITQEEYDLKSFMQKMDFFRPNTICFNGKKAASIFLSWHYKRKIKTSQINYGPMPIIDNKFKFFVAPSTSGSARRYWEPIYWYELSRIIKSN